MTASLALWCLSGLLGIGPVSPFAYRTPALAAQAPPPMAVIVNAANGTEQLEAPTLKRLFTSQLPFWPDGKRVVALNYPNQHPLRVRFDRVVLGMEPDRVGEFWIDQLVRAKARPPAKVPTPAMAVRLVAAVAGGIAYVPLDEASTQVKVVAVVRQGKVVSP